MMESSDSNSVVSFGPFEVNFRTQEIRRHGTVVRLSGQPFQILEMLLARRGELVTREELQQLLWPGASLVDCTHGLNAAINKLRESLGDSAITPQYVETLPRRGYRFIGEVHEPSNEESASIVAAPMVSEDFLASLHQPEVPQPVYAPTRRWPIALVACAALLTGILGGVGLNSHFQKPSGPQAVVAPIGPVEVAKSESKERTAQDAAVSKSPTARSIRVGGASARPTVLRSSSSRVPRIYPTLRTVVSGSGSAAPQFSPDGKHIAFMSNRSGPWQIWVSSVDGSHPVQISSTDSAGTPRWSPDGKEIVFDAPCDQGTCVFIASIDRSGPSRQLDEGRVPSFSRDGKWIYFASDRHNDWQVWKIRRDGGSAVQVTKKGGFAALESSDGFLYYAKSGWEPEIWRTPIGGGEESLVSSKVRPDTWSSWTVTQKGILFGSEADGKRPQLSLYDPSTGKLHELLTLPSSPRWMGATADGRRVAVNNANESEITLVENLR
ncbi:MAG TPA: winged helix-turn-helix domain-containing protein [Terriglobales bacterium]|nr:winged helix-turn-helix domain-containing protein [Terriglobales bacterium]